MKAEQDAGQAAPRGDNEAMWPTDADRLKAFVQHHEAEVALLQEALANLLEDTEHAYHNCPDPECPVAIARSLLPGDLRSRVTPP